MGAFAFKLILSCDSVNFDDVGFILVDLIYRIYLF